MVLHCNIYLNEIGFEVVSGNLIYLKNFNQKVVSHPFGVDLSLPERFENSK